MAVKTPKPGVTTKDGEPGYGLSDDDFDIAFADATLGLFQHNWHDDSDFHALVWDGKQLTDVMYSTTRCWTYAHTATVDATAKVKTQAVAWLFKRDIAAWTEAAERDALAIQPACRVRVVKGRKVPIGTEGILLLRQPSQFGGHHGRAPDRCQIRPDAGTRMWTSVTNLELIPPPGDWTPEREIERRTSRQLRRLGATGRPEDFVAAYRNPPAGPLYGGAWSQRPEAWR